MEITILKPLQRACCREHAAEDRLAVDAQSDYWCTHTHTHTHTCSWHRHPPSRPLRPLRHHPSHPPPVPFTLMFLTKRSVSADFPTNPSPNTVKRSWARLRTKLDPLLPLDDELLGAFFRVFAFASPPPPLPPPGLLDSDWNL